MDDQSLCAICLQGHATVFCTCQQTVSYICEKCIPQHCQKLQSGMHDFCAIEDAQLVQQVSLETFKSRKLNIAQGIALIESMQKQEQEDYTNTVQSLANIFQSISFLVDSLHETFATAFDLVRQSIQSTLRQEERPEIIEFILTNSQVMQKLRVNFFRFPALVEIENCREQLEVAINTFQSTDFAAYILTKMKNEFLTKGAEAMGTTEKGAPFLPVLKHNILRKYFANEAGGMALIEYPLSTNVDRESVYVFMDNGGLFCCGGKVASRQAFIVSVNSSKVTVLPFMIHSRSCPGVIAYNAIPYVFGGRNGSLCLSVCERFNSEERWEQLPGMMTEARCSFCPVLYNSLIYLPGGIDSNIVDVYEPVSMTFRYLEISLPFHGENLAFVHCEKLYVLAKKNLVTIDLRTEKTVAQEAKLEIETDTWSPAGPVKVLGKVYFWGFEAEGFSCFFRMKFSGKLHAICYCYDIEKKVVKQIERFEYPIEEI